MVWLFIDDSICRRFIDIERFSRDRQHANINIMLISGRWFPFRKGNPENRRCEYRRIGSGNFFTVSFHIFCEKLYLLSENVRRSTCRSFYFFIWISIICGRCAEYCSVLRCMEISWTFISVFFYIYRFEYANRCFNLARSLLIFERTVGKIHDEFLRRSYWIYYEF